MHKIVLLLLLVPALAFAQPADPAPAAAAPAAADPAPAAPAPAAAAPGSADHSPAELRQICADAMNKNHNFAVEIVKTINEQTAKQHIEAAEHVATNERHVILAYAAMWVVAALFVIFLWRRQLALRAELARLKRDLEAAIKEPAK